MPFTSIEQMVTAAEYRKVPLSAVVLRQESGETGVAEPVLLDRMRVRLDVMRASCHPVARTSASGLCGGNACRYQHASSRGLLLSDIVSGAMVKAMAVSEYNACMGRIVAAPTAGSCGILPGVLLSLAEEKQLEDAALLAALLTAAGIGAVIAQKASISGAAGGCQAECGSASAMAASAAVELLGGTPSMCAQAAALALKFILGLTCDPVGGLVEVPCVKRNASGAVNALTAAELALCGIRSVIPADEVIEAMEETGRLMHTGLKETAKNGLAATKTAKKLMKEVRSHAECRCHKG